MVWNWQQNDWPNFRWNASLLVQAEKRFLVGGGILLGATAHLEPEERRQLTIELMSSEALNTSEIEGETLDRASIQSSIKKKLGLSADDTTASLAEQGVAEMTVDALLTFDKALTQEGLCFWQSLAKSAEAPPIYGLGMDSATPFRWRYICTLRVQYKHRDKHTDTTKSIKQESGATRVLPVLRIGFCPESRTFVMSLGLLL